jgi:hypothetical protein
VLCGTMVARNRLEQLKKLSRVHRVERFHRVLFAVSIAYLSFTCMGTRRVYLELAGLLDLINHKKTRDRLARMMDDHYGIEQRESSDRASRSRRSSQ